MSSMKLLVVAGFGVLAAGCSSSTTTYERQAAVPYAATGSEQACMDYGFRPGTDAYNRCVVREADARARGRMPREYTPVQLTDDARNACNSYGLVVGTPTYDRCLAREVDARRYRQDALVPAPVVYYPAPAPVVAAPVQPTPAAGVEVFRDEYGFRYDGQGNRIDRGGNIISPQSTRP